MSEFQNPAAHNNHVSANRRCIAAQVRGNVSVEAQDQNGFLNHGPYMLSLAHCAGAVRGQCLDNLIGQSAKKACTMTAPWGVSCNYRVVCICS